MDYKKIMSQIIALAIAVFIVTGILSAWLDMEYGDMLLLVLIGTAGIIYFIYNKNKEIAISTESRMQGIERSIVFILRKTLVADTGQPHEKSGVNIAENEGHSIIMIPFKFLLHLLHT